MPRFEGEAGKGFYAIRTNFDLIFRALYFFFVPISLCGTLFGCSFGSKRRWGFGIGVAVFSLGKASTDFFALRQTPCIAVRGPIWGRKLAV